MPSDETSYSQQECFKFAVSLFPCIKILIHLTPLQTLTATHPKKISSHSAVKRKQTRFDEWKYIENLFKKLFSYSFKKKLYNDLMLLNPSNIKIQYSSILELDGNIISMLVNEI